VAASDSSKGQPPSPTAAGHLPAAVFHQVQLPADPIVPVQTILTTQQLQAQIVQTHAQRIAQMIELNAQTAQQAQMVEQIRRDLQAARRCSCCMSLSTGFHCLCQWIPLQLSLAVSSNTCIPATSSSTGSSGSVFGGIPRVECCTQPSLSARSRCSASCSKLKKEKACPVCHSILLAPPPNGCRLPKNLRRPPRSVCTLAPSAAHTKLQWMPHGTR
jgi:hypothetical protein